MTHEELFTAYYPLSIPLTVMETEDGHVYPMGSFHDCDHRDCPASRDDTPETDLGEAGFVENEFWREFGVSATEENLKKVRETCL